MESNKKYNYNRINANYGELIIDKKSIVGIWFDDNVVKSLSGPKYLIGEETINYLENVHSLKFNIEQE